MYLSIFIKYYLDKDSHYQLSIDKIFLIKVQALIGFKPGWLGLSAGWIAQRGERTDKQTTYIWTENLPILQDFVPYWGRCPASLHKK